MNADPQYYGESQSSNESDSEQDLVQVQINQDINEEANEEQILDWVFHERSESDSIDSQNTVAGIFIRDEDGMVHWLPANYEAEETDSGHSSLSQLSETESQSSETDVDADVAEEYAFNNSHNRESCK